MGETDVMVSLESEDRTWEGLGCELLEACEGLTITIAEEQSSGGLRAGD